MLIASPKKLVYFLTLVLACAFFMLQSPASAQQKRPGVDPRNQQTQPKAASKQKKMASQMKQAAEDIDSATVEMLEIVNDADSPTDDDLDYYQTILQDNKKFVSKLAKESPSIACRYHTLNAWAQFFRDNLDDSMKFALKAYKTDIENSDAKVTQTAIAILTGNKPVTLKPKKKKGRTRPNARRPQRQMPRGGPRGMEPGDRFNAGSKSGDILELDIKAINLDMIGTEVSPFQALCVNSTIFAYAPNQDSLCILLWQLDKNTSRDRSETPAEPNSPSNNQRGKKPAPPTRNNRRNTGRPMPGRPMPRGRFSPDLGNQKLDPFDTQIQAFADIFKAEYSNPYIKFIAINTDTPANKDRIVKKLLDEPWPWAHAIADGSQTGTAQFTGSDNTIPTLIVVSNSGKIIYSGPATGFLPKMVLKKFAAATFDSSQTRPRPSTANPFTQLLNNAANNIPQTKPAPKPVSNEPDKDDVEAIAIEVQAGKLLEHARMFVDASRKRFQTPKKGIELCRQVMHDYPDTEYYQKAQMILRRVPERYHKRYNITNEELGL